MKELILLRHAKSSWKHKQLRDIERPLSKTGFAEMAETAFWIKSKKINPDLIYCSPAARTYHTFLLAAQASKWDIEKLILKPGLYESSLNDYLNELTQTPDTIKSVLIVGHNPVISQLSGFITKRDNEILTGSLQVLTLNIRTWKEVKKNCGTLIEEFVPTRHRGYEGI